MSDPQALTRLLDELLWTLRRGGFSIATSSAIDVARAAVLVGWEERTVLKTAIAALVVKRARDQHRFELLFDRFFAREEPSGTLWQRPAARGFTSEELEAVRELLNAFAAVSSDAMSPLGALLERGAELDRLLGLAGVTRALAAMQNRLQAGFLTHRVLSEVGVPKARDALGKLRATLREAFGEARGDALAQALEGELSLAEGAVRAHVQETFAQREAEGAELPDARRLENTVFTALSDVEMEEVRRALRRLAERLRGRARVRARRASKGRIDPHKTLRLALRTGGAPFTLARKARRRDRPRLMLLCDVSDSVRTAARFMLEFVYAAHELFERTRSFVFVSELGEATALFEREPVAIALGKAYGGGLISVADNSNYGRVLRTFEAKYLHEVTRDTTVVVLGDGRTNYHEAEVEVLDHIRARARALLWLCPEPERDWAVGDSAMARYAARCTRVLEARSAADLDVAARALLALR